MNSGGDMRVNFHAKMRRIVRIGGNPYAFARAITKELMAMNELADE